MGESKKPHWFTETSTFKDFLKKHNVTIEIFTCNDCGISDKCEFAFDFYNTNGDCLGSK